MLCYGPGWLLLAAFFVCYLWKIGFNNRWSSNMHAKALIHFNLLIPSSSTSLLALHRSPFNRTKRLSRDATHRRKHRGTKYMLQLYQRRPDADVVRAIQPEHVSTPLSDGGRILEFVNPSVGIDETFKAAELLGIDGAIVRVRLLNDLSTRNGSEEIRRSRKDDVWRAFDITPAVTGRKNGDTVKLYVHGRFTYHLNGDSPILLLNYTKIRGDRRHRRSADQEQEDQDRWEDDDFPRRRRRNNCHRRPMYVDFTLIQYDSWVIAPPGYQAYQCSGKCSFPLGDHLSPTNHAIVQALLHGAFQASDNLRGNKFVGRACCVPTKLAPTSLLYMYQNIVTYEYDYEDMVVVECGCR